MLPDGQWISYPAIMTIHFLLSVEVMVLLSSWVRHHIAMREFDCRHCWIRATWVLCPANDAGWPLVVRKITLIQVSSISKSLSHPNDKILHLFHNRCQRGTLMVTNRASQSMSFGAMEERYTGKDGFDWYDWGSHSLGALSFLICIIKSVGHFYNTLWI